MIILILLVCAFMIGGVVGLAVGFGEGYSLAITEKENETN